MKSTRRNRWRNRNFFKRTIYGSHRCRLDIYDKEDQPASKSNSILCYIHITKIELFIGPEVFMKFGFSENDLYGNVFTVHFDPATGKVWKIKRDSYIRLRDRFFQRFRKEFKKYLGVQHTELPKHSCMRIRRNKNGTFKRIGIAV